MATAGTRQRSSRDARRRLVLLVMALHVLLDPVLSAGTVLRHQHDGIDAHEHVLPAWAATAHHHGRHPAGDDPHRHAEEHQPHHHAGWGGPTPTLLIDLPGLGLLGSAVVTSTAAPLTRPSAEPLSDRSPSWDDGSSARRLRCTAGDGQAQRPGGLLGVLRSSHALLI